MSTCVVCLRPVATTADEQTWVAVNQGAPLPSGWADATAEHLCWYAIYGDATFCESPRDLPAEWQQARFLGTVANALGDRCPPPDAPPEAWAAAIHALRSA